MHFLALCVKRKSNYILEMSSYKSFLISSFLCTICKAGLIPMLASFSIERGVDWKLFL